MSVWHGHGAGPCETTHCRAGGSSTSPVKRAMSSSVHVNAVRGVADRRELVSDRGRCPAGSSSRTRLRWRTWSGARPRKRSSRRVTAPAFSDFEQLVQQIMLPPAARARRPSRPRCSTGRSSQRPGSCSSSGPPTSSRKRSRRTSRSSSAPSAARSTTSARRARSKQTPGLPDLWVTHKARGLAFWFEVKRSKEFRISDAQADFRVECTAAGVNHCWGDRRTAAKLLVDLGLARVGEGPCGIVPFHEAAR
jgi:hypothetical protein